MSFAHKVVLLVMQQQCYLVRLNKRQIFFHMLLFCRKARPPFSKFNLRGNFFQRDCEGSH